MGRETFKFKSRYAWKAVWTPPLSAMFSPSVNLPLICQDKVHVHNEIILNS